MNGSNKLLRAAAVGGMVLEICLLDFINRDSFGDLVYHDDLWGSSTSIYSLHSDASIETLVDDFVGKGYKRVGESFVVIGFEKRGVEVKIFPGKLQRICYAEEAGAWPEVTYRRGEYVVRRRSAKHF